MPFVLIVTARIKTMNIYDLCDLYKRKKEQLVGHELVIIYPSTQTTRGIFLSLKDKHSMVIITLLLENGERLNPVFYATQWQWSAMKFIIL